MTQWCPITLLWTFILKFKPWLIFKRTCHSNSQLLCQLKSVNVLLMWRSAKDSIDRCSSNSTVPGLLLCFITNRMPGHLSWIRFWIKMSSRFHMLKINNSFGSGVLMWCEVLFMLHRKETLLTNLSADTYRYSWRRVPSYSDWNIRPRLSSSYHHNPLREIWNKPINTSSSTTNGYFHTIKVTYWSSLCVSVMLKAKS